MSVIGGTNCVASISTWSRKTIDRLVRLCSCLFNQLDLAATAEAIVHLCEISLGAMITSANVYDANQVKYPGRENFAFPPIMPAIACETLASCE
jgi:hypothetical protein